MVTVPKCPDILPDEIEGLLHELATHWRDSSLRPRVDDRVLAHWDGLLEEWVNCADLPLFIRKSQRGAGRGWVLKHRTGRELVPTDNTPANWSLTLALQGKCPSLEDIRASIRNDAVPVAMAMTKAERDGARFKGTRAEFAELNALGWKVCHKVPVGLRQRGSITEIPLEVLSKHFLAFIAPSNMFLVPKVLSGLGELPHLTEVMRGQV